MRLDRYIELAQKKVKCAICTYADYYEDMIEIEDENGERVLVHQECLEAQDYGHENHNHKGLQ